MRSNQHRPRSGRHPHVEMLESRHVMSADPLGAGMEHHALSDADFWYDPRDFDDIEQSLGEIEQLLWNANNLTGLTQARAAYGFTGIGQTVAVIDSGIAWDHWALGGGFGSEYRVVGGWDFTEENDSNPYDDGPEGSHGTHVAGIIGSTHTTHTGVAPGVDLVGLRVFNDAGQGYFSWVEKALQWVYTNRNAFANPITAVNLSLGTSWNATTVPNWSTLEDEFAALKSVGIFTAVSAGNSYTTYNAPGLSYPAASPHVVPVMSVDDNGLMSGFSQRHTSAIAAPGRTIMSTVPDYAGNHNGATDDFASKSGTSMAAPYVAGASVLIRQAMQFVGMTNITQGTIYNHMRATADEIGTTGYLRLNLGNAIDALIPDDEYGSTVATAYSMGTVSNSTQIAGMINTLSDSDYFRFTAGITGTVSFTASLSHGQTANWLASGLNGWTSGTGGQTYNFNIIAGQAYTLGLSATGLSYFTLNVAVESSLTFLDWGAITQKSIDNVSQSGERLYRVQTSQAGYLTAEALFSSGSIAIDWLNASMQQIASGSSVVGGQRVDVMATGGQHYYLRVTGTSADIDFRLTNLVSISGSTATIGGTSLADAFTFSTSTQHTATVNGVAYQFSKASVSTINFNGGAGSDSIVIVGTADNETATIHVGSAVVVGSDFTVNATSTESITVYGNGGNDGVTMYGSNSDDLYSVWWDRARMSGHGYFNEARHFNTTLAYALNGFDRAYLYDTALDDTFTAWWDRATMTNSAASHEVRGFDRTVGCATIGNDSAILYDTAGNDTFSAWWDRAVMFGTGYNNETMGFKSTTAYASSGFDQAFLYDSPGDDRYFAWADRVRMTGHNYRNEALGFDETFGTASVGNDRADLYDSAGDDVYTAWWNRVRMAGGGFVNEATGFDRTKGHATAGGNNSAKFYDSPGRDVFAAWPDHAVMYGPGYFNDSVGFNSVTGYASENYDKASFYDSAGDDVYTAWWNRILMVGNGFRNEAHGFDRTMGRGARGNDTATLYDSPGDDQFTAWPTHAVMYGSYGGGFFNDTWLFPSVVAIASSGNDRASFYDSEGDDLFRTWWNRALMTGNGYSNDARGFDRAVGRSSTGNDRAIMYDSGANDSVHAMAWGAYMTDYAKYHNEARGFAFIEARRTEGGADRAFLSTIDYLFELIGGWSA